MTTVPQTRPSRGPLTDLLTGGGRGRRVRTGVPGAREEAQR